jgi:protein-S-isoprenylcysteine O-methyltransferase Ste14
LLFLFTNIRADLEEGALEDRYPEYSVYKAGTKRYLPYIY